MGCERRIGFLRIVDFHVFRCSVVVMCGDLNEIRLKYDREIKRRKVRNPYSFSEIRTLVEDSLGVDSLGVACGFSKTGGDVFVYLRNWSSSCFVHEAHHAIHKMLENRGVDDEEACAYHLEYLFDQVVNTGEFDRSFYRRDR